MNFTLVPTKSKDYSEGKVETSCIANFPEYHDWVSKYYGKKIPRKKFFHFSKTIYGDNREKFTKLFGKRQFVFRGEYLLSGWRLDLEGTQCIIFTAKGGGTCWEIVTEIDGKKVPVNVQNVLKFMDQLLGGLP